MVTAEDPQIVEFDVRTDEMLVNMGPQHPSTHGVLRLVLRTDGEIVSEVDSASRLPCIVVRKKSARILRRGNGFPTRTEWTTWPR